MYEKMNRDVQKLILHDKNESRKKFNLYCFSNEKSTIVNKLSG